MKGFIILFVFLVAGYFFLLKDNNSTVSYTGQPYVNIYGRNSCGNTTAMRNYLTAQGIPYNYYQVDDRKVADPMHEKMRKAGINTSHYYLPVVEINGQFSTNPRPTAVKATFFSNNR